MYGSVGIKVWVYRGEVLPEKQILAAIEAENKPRRARRKAAEKSLDDGAPPTDSAETVQPEDAPVESAPTAGKSPAAPEKKATDVDA
ncbi:MAG: hypothetical protein IIC73_08295 [Armatimonadetes bacterium]|nr:hypothetical protein [Armatimonadota bacterium]